MLEKRVGNIDVAREKFKMCLKVNPKNAKVYQAWGVLEAAEDNIALATELFRAGLEQKPDNTYIMQVQQYVRAAPHRTAPLDACFAICGVSGPIIRCCGMNGRVPRDSLDVFFIGSNLGPLFFPICATESNQAWALMEAKQSNTEAATSLFKKAILKRPRDGAVWQAYALLLKVTSASQDMAWHGMA